MLAPTPYQVPTGEDKEEDEEAQGGSHSGSTLGNLSREIGISTSKGGREGRTDIPSPHGKKRTASEDLKAEASKRGKMSLSNGSGSEDDVTAQFLRKDKPFAKS